MKTYARLATFVRRSKSRRGGQKGAEEREEEVFTTTTTTRFVRPFVPSDLEGWERTAENRKPSRPSPAPPTIPPF